MLMTMSMFADGIARQVNTDINGIITGYTPVDLVALADKTSTTDDVFDSTTGDTSTSGSTTTTPGTATQDPQNSVNSGSATSSTITTTVISGESESGTGSGRGKRVIDHHHISVSAAGSLPHLWAFIMETTVTILGIAASLLF